MQASTPCGAAPRAATDIPDVPVLVVGAGPSGLAAARELDRRRVGVRIIDAAPQVALPWRRRHEALRLNTHRSFSGLPGLRVPRSAGAFPSRDAYVAYLEAYERFLGIGVEWNVRMERIDRHARGWRVLTSAAAIVAAHVVVATGPDREPYTPKWPGADAFRGEWIHAAGFRHARDYAGRRVLVVGGATSAVDLVSCLLGEPLERLWMSVRRASTVLPRRWLGVPIQPLGVLTRWLPVAQQDRSARQLSRRAFGDLSRYGWPEPPLGPYARFLAEGRVRVVPEIEQLDASGVQLADGTRIEPDAVICATGYRPGLEPALLHLGLLDEAGRPRFADGRPDPRAPGLWFLGHASNFHGNLHARGREARRLARAVAASLRGRRSPGA